MMSTAQIVVDGLVADGTILPEYRDLAIKHLDSELTRYTKALVSKRARDAGRAFFMGMIKRGRGHKTAFAG